MDAKSCCETKWSLRFAGAAAGVVMGAGLRCLSGAGMWLNGRGFSLFSTPWGVYIDPSGAAVALQPVLPQSAG